MAEYLEVSNASPAVKAKLARVRASLESEGINESCGLPKNTCKFYTTRSSFVKVENCCYETPLGVLKKAPRLIQGGKAEYIALVGPTFVTIQREIKRIWGKSFAVWFTSGATAGPLSKYITRNVSWRIFENDVSAFDTCVGRDLCNLELWLAKKFGAYRTVLDLMRANIDTRGWTMHGVKYSVDGTRKSGDPFTSCFNSVLNGLMHLYAASDAGAVPVSVLLGKVQMLVQGDDNLLRHSNSLRPNWDILLRLGFKCENNYRTHISDAEFCSCRFWNTTVGWVLGPKPGKVLQKLCVFNNPPKAIHPLSVVRGIAFSLFQYSYVPFIKEVADSLLRISFGFKEHYERPNDWVMGGGNFTPVHIDNLANLYHVYGLSVIQTAELRQECSSLSVRRGFQHPLFEVLFDKDSDGDKMIFATAA